MKKIFSIVISLTMLFTCFGGFQFAALAGDLYAGGSGITGDPYIIMNEVHFDNIRSNPTAFFSVQNNIDLTKLSSAYVPFEFQGKLTGSNTDMNNLWKINVSITSTTANTGLFTLLSGTGSSISYLELTGSVTVTGSVSNTGGFAGQIGAHSITHCINRANITSAYNLVGGLVGYTASSSGKIENCANYGAITGNSTVGGLVGSSYANITLSRNHGTITVKSNNCGGLVGNQACNINQSYNTGEVYATNTTASKALAGGISGYVPATVTNKVIQNCYNYGKITSNYGSSSGIAIAILGSAISIINCYNAGELVNPNSVFIPIYKDTTSATISNCYYLSDTKTSDNVNNTTALDKSEMKSLSYFTGFNPDAQNLIWKMIPDSGYFYPQIIENLHPAVERGNSADFPYIIDSAEAFEILKNKPGKYYSLTNDIILPSTYEPFELVGIFFGSDSTNLKSIHVTIDKSIELTDNVGLFTSISGLTQIKNIKLTGSVKGNSFVGGLIGRAGTMTAGTSIDNCINEATITGLGSNVGGIAGGATSSSITATNLINKGNITGSSNVGGIFGSSTSISYSKNLGKITGLSNNVGGLAGFLYGSISNSYNNGNVTGNKSVGGIGGSVGGNGKNFQYCYNTGIITSTATNVVDNEVGGIMGGLYQATYSSAINYCYNLGDVISGINSFNPIFPTHLADTTKIKASNCYYMTPNGEVDGKDDTEPKILGDMNSLSITGFQKSTNPNFEFPEIINNLQTETVRFSTVTSSTDGHATIIPNGAKYVKSGNTVTYTITANDSYMIDHINYGTAEISILNNTQGGQYTTPVINSDTTVTVLTKDFVFPAEIANDTVALQTSYVPERYETVIVGTAEITTPYGVSFARVNEYKGYLLKEYGMLFSKANSNLNMESFDHKAPGATKNALGQFGILFYGTGIDTATTYYTRAYAVYEKDGNELILLGTASQFITAE